MATDFKKMQIDCLRRRIVLLSEPGQWDKYPENQRRYLERRDEEHIADLMAQLIKAMGK